MTDIKHNMKHNKAHL